jgi:protein phosphatase
MALIPKAYGRSDIGNGRETNEDSLLVGRTTFVVSDGMGGHESGEVASNCVVSVFEDILEAPGNDATVDDVIRNMGGAFDRANEEVRNKARSLRLHDAMGATAAAVCFQGESAVCGWVGDSRIYRLRGGVLSMISRDHQYANELYTKGMISKEEFDSHPDKHVISRALGYKATAEVEIAVLPLEPRDRFIICSDGLTTAVPEREIGEFSDRYAVPEHLVEALIQRAKDKGSADNVTVIVADVEDAVAGGDGPPRTRVIPVSLSLNDRRPGNRARRTIAWVVAVVLSLGLIAGVAAVKSSRFARGIPLLKKNTVSPGRLPVKNDAGQPAETEVDRRNGRSGMRPDSGAADE